MKNLVIVTLGLVCLTICLPVFSNKFPEKNILNPRLECFVENKGQWPQDVICRADIPGGQAWITKKGIIYDYYHLESELNIKNEKIPVIKKSGHVVYFEYFNCLNKISVEKRKKKEGKLNYFIGNDQTKWASDVERFGEVLIKGIYNGISLRYYFQKGNLRYDFIVDNGNPNDISIKVEGAPVIKTNAGIILKTSEGDIIHKDLRTYQIIEGKKTSVSSHWKKVNNLIKFQIGPYNKNKKLIIDPIIYSTYLGTGSTTSQHYETGIKIKADNQGNAIVTGITTENAFPTYTTFGTYINNSNTDWEIFISKLNSSGTSLIFSSLIGGSGIDEPTNMLLENNQIFVCGNTLSHEFPVINGNFQTTKNGLTDGFILKLNNSGNSLLSSTYFGGSDNDYIFDIKFNALNNSIYVCGNTKSNDFPITSSVFQSTINNQTDGYISAFNLNLTSLVHSSYIGGTDESEGDEVITSILPSADGNIYFSGYSDATDFPITNNLGGTAFTNINSGGMDIVFGKMNAQLNQLNLSGYLGGVLDEKGPVLLHSELHNEFILLFNTNSYTLSFSCSGTTQTVNALNGTNDIYILKIDDNNLAPKKCCFLGGMSDEVLKDADFDVDGNVYLTGFSQSYDFPETSQQLFNLNNTSFNSIIIAEFDNNLNNIYSESLEIGLNDYGNSIFVNKYTKAIYLTGETNSINGFPVSSGAYQTTKPGDSDPFVIKFMLNGNPVLNVPNSNTVCLNTNFSVAVEPDNFINYTFIAPNGSTLQSSPANTILIPITSATQSGNYSVSVQMLTGVDNLTFDIVVLPLPDLTNALQVNPNFTVCYGKTVNIQPNAISPYTLTSSNINFNTNYTVTNPIPFTVFATYSNALGYGCTYPKSYTVFPTAALNTSVTQYGFTLTSLETASYVTYQWKDCNIQDNITGATQQTFSPIQPGSFYVKLFSPYCIDSSECKTVNPNAPFVNITSSNVTCLDKRNGNIKIDYIAPYPYKLYKTKWTPDICNKDTCLFLSGLSAGTYTIELEFKHEFNSSSDVTLTFTVLIEDSSQPCIIKPYNSLVIGSNNGYFHIDGISEFADNEVYIFSRCGNKMADIRNYNNADKKWPEKNATVMPGTYYYIIKINTNSKPIKGWFEVIE